MPPTLEVISYIPLPASYFVSYLRKYNSFFPQNFGELWSDQIMFCTIKIDPKRNFAILKHAFHQFFHTIRIFAEISSSTITCYLIKLILESWATGSNFDMWPKLWWAFGEESRGPKIDWHGRIKSVSGTPNYFGFIFTPVPRICVSFFPDHVSGVEGQSAIWHQLIGGCPIQLAPATNSHLIVSHKPDILKLYCSD